MLFRSEPVRATPVLDQTTAVPVMADDLASAPPRRSRRGLGFWLLGLAVLGVIVGGALLVKSLLLPSVTVQVPDLTGLSTAQAQTVLSQKGLTLGPITKEASDKPADTIIRQDPGAFSDAKQGTAVTVVLSSGPAKTTVPAIVSLSLDEASRLLSEAGLKLGTKTPKQSDAPGNQVLESDPPEGTNVDVGSTVNEIGRAHV